MKLLIVSIIAFLVLVYVYTYIRFRKRRQNNKSAVAEFNEKYLNKEKKSMEKQNTRDSNYKKYITKYNSEMDYISKDEL